MTTSQAEAQREGHGELKRVMGPKLLLLFIVGDILGAGIYAVTGEMAAEVGGIVWLPFLLAFVVALLTAGAYLELVTRYPQAAGAALYAHKAFGLHFVTFLVAFAVICSGITSASTSANLLSEYLLEGLSGLGLGVSTGTGTVTAVAIAFILLLAVVNLWGAGQSVRLNVFLTVIEVTALAIVIGVGFWAMSQGKGDLSRLVVFESGSERGMFAAVTVATAVAFFAMVGFEDSVNMVEEVHDPRQHFPRVMFTGLGIAVLAYMLVAVAVITVIPAGEIQRINDEDGKVLIEVVRAGAPGIPVYKLFPFLTVFAVANTALINMMMASRLLYGLAKQNVLPRSLGSVLPGRRTPWTGIVFATVLALALVIVVTVWSDTTVVDALSGTTGLLLLVVFGIVNISCLVVRRDPLGRKDGFHIPTVVPVLGAITCFFLAGPWARDSEDWVQYTIAGSMLAIGVVLWLVTWLTNKTVRHENTKFADIDQLGE